MGDLSDLFTVLLPIWKIISAEIKFCKMGTFYPAEVPRELPVFKLDTRTSFHNSAMHLFWPLLYYSKRKGCKESGSIWMNIFSIASFQNDKIIIET